MIDEQTLTLYYFDDGLEPQQREQVRQALQNDHLLAARYKSLCTELNALKGEDVAPAPAGLKQGWHQLIADQAGNGHDMHSASDKPKPAPVVDLKSAGDGTTYSVVNEAGGYARPRRSMPQWLGWSGALAAMLVLGMAIGVLIQPGSETPQSPILATADQPAQLPSVEQNVPTQHTESFRRGLAVYLQQSQASLESLGQEQDQDGHQQDELIRDIVAQNRLFARAAEASDAPEIARLMRALEPVLLQLADQIKRNTSDALRRQLNFELQAMLTKLEQPASNQAPTI